jgi:hypothetical protein
MIKPFPTNRKNIPNVIGIVIETASFHTQECIPDIANP